MAFGIKADLILINGRIWRGREEGISEALAVWQGKILATGSDTDILGLKGPRTEVIDLEGRFATPGLIDNHLHLIATGMAMGWVDATPASAPTLAALMGRISTAQPRRRRAAGCAPAAMIRSSSTPDGTRRATISIASPPITQSY